MLFKNQPLEVILLQYDIKPSPNGKFLDCWWWTGTLYKTKYGKAHFNGKCYYAHRLSMHFHLKFDLDNPLKICHKCDNPTCINPDHLFIGTQRDNVLDMDNKNRRVSFRKYDEMLVTEIIKDFNSGISRHNLSLKYKIPYQSIVDLVKRVPLI